MLSKLVSRANQNQNLLNLGSRLSNTPPHREVPRDVTSPLTAMSSPVPHPHCAYFAKVQYTTPSALRVESPWAREPHLTSRQLRFPCHKQPGPRKF